MASNRGNGSKSAQNSARLLGLRLKKIPLKALCMRTFRAPFRMLMTRRKRTKGACIHPFCRKKDRRYPLPCQKKKQAVRTHDRICYIEIHKSACLDTLPGNPLIYKSMIVQKSHKKSLKNIIRLPGRNSSFNQSHSPPSRLMPAHAGLAILCFLLFQHAKVHPPLRLCRNVIPRR